MTGGVTPGAARQARYRERRREAQRLTAELLSAGRDEARQAGLPLAPVGELEDAPASAMAAHGRPAGSVARSTAEMQRFMLSRYRSPLVGLAEIAARPARDLAEELGCSPLEAFDRQLKAMGELAPYLHSKMPAAVQVDGVPLTPVVVHVSGELAARMGVPTVEGESQEIQGLGIAH